MTLLERVRPFTDGRPYLVALATLNAIFGLAALTILVPLSFGFDVETYRRGAVDIESGVIATGYLYAPLFAVLARPLTLVSLPIATVALGTVSLIILVAGVRIETRGMALMDRLLVVIAVLGFVPLVYELVVGQVTLFIAAAVYAVRDRDGGLRGIPLGIVLALVPKPLLLPLLAWMLLRRRRALGSAVMTALAMTAAGIGLLGIDIYSRWLDALAGTGQITRQGNQAISDLGSPELVVPLVVLVIAVAGWVILREEGRGFVAALVAGLLIAPYTQMYSVSILLLAVRPALAIVPRATRLLAFVANPAVLIAFLPWAAAVLVSVVPTPRRSQPGG
jgi:hypothetical protein